MAKAWVIPISEELNKEAFEEAHKLRVSKSEFVRQAVKEKIILVKKAIQNKGNISVSKTVEEVKEAVKELPSKFKPCKHGGVKELCKKCITGN